MQRDIVTRLEVVAVRLESALSDHEARIRVLEQRSWRAAGAVAFILVMVPVVLHFMK